MCIRDRYDTMQFVTPDIATICTGMAASMAAVLMSAGAPGKRSALRHARIMMHQPSAGAAGQASDVEITVNEVRKVKHELYEILSNHTGQTIEKVAKDSNRDYWMTAEDAKNYGLIDEVLLTISKKIKDMNLYKKNSTRFEEEEEPEKTLPKTRWKK